MPEETTKPDDPLVGTLMRQYTGLDHMMASTLVACYRVGSLDTHMDGLQIKSNGNEQPTPPNFTCEVINPD